MSHLTPGQIQKITTVNPLWKPRSRAALSIELPTLPLETLQTASPQLAANAGEQQRRFSETIQLLKENLFSAKKTAILARSQSMETGKRQSLCRNAVQLYDRAIELKNELRLLTARMDLAARRKVRSLEGAPEWREIRHAIRRSAELNKIKLSFAA